MGKRKHQYKLFSCVSDAIEDFPEEMCSNGTEAIKEEPADVDMEWYKNYNDKSENGKCPLHVMFDKSFW